MSTRYHVCQSVRGALMNWTKRDWKRNLRHDDGRPCTEWEAKKFMLDQLALGREVIPLTNPPCDGFDYKTGCPGHPEPAPPAERAADGASGEGRAP